MDLKLLWSIPNFVELIINTWNIYLQQPHSSEGKFSQEVHGGWLSLHIRNGLLYIHWNLKQRNNDKQASLLLRSVSSDHCALNPFFPILKLDKCYFFQMYTVCMSCILQWILLAHGHPLWIQSLPVPHSQQSCKTTLNIQHLFRNLLIFPWFKLCSRCNYITLPCTVSHFLKSVMFPDAAARL